MSCEEKLAIMVYYSGNLQIHLSALEDEFRKMRMFHRELPVACEVINQTIDAWKKKLMEKDGFMDCDLNFSDDRTSLDQQQVVPEEFMPPRGDEKREETNKVCRLQKSDSKKRDWLKSAQLWNPIPDLNSQQDDEDDEDDDSPPVIPEKPSAKALHQEPGRGEHKTSGKLLSAAGKSEENHLAGNSHRKQRRCWSNDLHRRFINALQDLGGPLVATPKQIKEQMKIDGLTNDEIKSHLQKYRLHMRRSPVASNDTFTRAPQLVVVGGIWVPPPDFTAVAISVPLPSKSKISAPVATIPTHRLTDRDLKTSPVASSSARTIAAA